MKQIFQNQKTGELIITELPTPALLVGGVIVKNKFSLVSTGTERQSVSTSKAGLFAKARMRPDLVHQVLENIKKEGIRPTYRKVISKLDNYKALGYSSSGVVVKSSCDEFQPGDQVACAGAGYAVHAEYIYVPKNLCVLKAPELAFEEAAFSTIGAIALQGVRQAEVSLGDTVVVIGMGLIGLLTIQLLHVSGCQVIGADISMANLELAKELGCNHTCLMEDLVQDVKQFSNGYGADSIILTASTKSSEPINLAGEVARKKGRIVIVGSVGLSAKRDPYFYNKELEIRLSTSYGPGRYDPLYEEYGIDYPIGYVRWTEKRNMESFLILLSQKKLQVSKLITNIFPIAESSKAYDILLEKNSSVISNLISYPDKSGRDNNKSFHTKKYAINIVHKPDKLVIGIIGAGNFARSFILPYLKSNNDVFLKNICTTNGLTSKSVAEKFHFPEFTTNINNIMKDDEINTVWISTRHDSHASLVLKALKNNKNVFIEKPLALSMKELNTIKQAYLEADSLIMVGYNRRFSEAALRMKNIFNNRQTPFLINYRVNAGYIPVDKWSQFPNQGGRIIGEVCHFVDYLQFLTGSLPIQLNAFSISSNSHNWRNEENVIITLKFKDGSIGCIQYVAMGGQTQNKELCEVFADRKSVILDNYRLLSLYKENSKKTFKFNGLKGHEEEIIATVSAFRNGKASPIDFETLYSTSLVTLKSVEMLNDNKSGLINIEY